MHYRFLQFQQIHNLKDYNNNHFLIFRYIFLQNTFPFLENYYCCHNIQVVHYMFV
nr:MAG TPA: hypothetical protein [Bacteriophage sp.]DAO05108.1 MAG TPA: hypothetical protein [Bacteriophage sp.]